MNSNVSANTIAAKAELAKNNIYNSPCLHGFYDGPCVCACYEMDSIASAGQTDKDLDNCLRDEYLAWRTAIKAKLLEKPDYEVESEYAFDINQVDDEESECTDQSEDEEDDNNSEVYSEYAFECGSDEVRSEYAMDWYEADSEDSSCDDSDDESEDSDDESEDEECEDKPRLPYSGDYFDADVYSEYAYECESDEVRSEFFMDWYETDTEDEDSCDDSDDESEDGGGDEVRSEYAFLHYAGKAESDGVSKGIDDEQESGAEDDVRSEYAFNANAKTEVCSNWADLDNYHYRIQNFLSDNVTGPIQYAYNRITKRCVLDVDDDCDDDEVYSEYAFDCADDEVESVYAMDWFECDCYQCTLEELYDEAPVPIQHCVDFISENIGLTDLLLFALSLLLFLAVVFDN